MHNNSLLVFSYRMYHIQTDVVYPRKQRCLLICCYFRCNAISGSVRTYSWVSRDVIISLGVNSKLMHSHRREIVFHCMCWPCVWQQICTISWDFFTPVRHNHQYILGWPPLRLTAKYPSETQEYLLCTFECIYTGNISSSILKITSSGLNFTQYGTFLFVNLPRHCPK